MWQRNLTVFVAIAGASFVLAWVLHAHPYLVRDPAWLRWTAGTGFVLFVSAGGAACLFLNGGFPARTGLASLAAAVAWPLSEIAFGAGLAFPGFSLALAGAAAAIAFLGSLVIAGPVLLWTRYRARRSLAGDR